MKKLMYGKRLGGLEDDRLVKIVAEKLKDAGGSMGHCRESMQSLNTEK